MLLEKAALDDPSNGSRSGNATFNLLGLRIAQETYLQHQDRPPTVSDDSQHGQNGWGLL